MQGEIVMKTMRDVFYDMNDILVALVIVALAAFVIISNINSILDYPSTLTASIDMPEAETPTTYAENPPITNDAIGSDTENQPTASDSGINTPAGDSTPENGEVVNYSIYVEWGATEDKIADLLVQVGLFDERDDFYKAVSEAGAEGKLQAGTFIIPSDSTPEEVIKIITE